MMTIALATASFVVVLLMRSTRSLGTLDPDTGLPNGLGIAQRLSHRDVAAPLVVVAVVLRGIDSAQEALGFQAGSELLRRAVEDIGQVLPSDAIIGRIGDELVVAQPVADGSLSPDEQRAESVPERAIEVARSLALTVGRAINAGRYFLDGVEVSLHAHAGLSVAPWDGGRHSRALPARVAQRQGGRGQRDHRCRLACQHPYADRRRPGPAGRPRNG
ncbi:MAG: GGDEF domain-containing protein [Acidimicrobiales bacterium]